VSGEVCHLSDEHVGTLNMTVLRCVVVDDIWHVAYQLEDGKETTPVEPFVAAFQGEDERGEPPYYQILPCPKCGVETDRNHNPLKHVYAELGTPIA
jgi:hypothetical protein